MAHLIRSAVLTKFLEVAQAVNLNPQDVLRQAGLTRALIEDPEQRIPSRAAVNLLEAAARASQCPTFGLRMAQARQLADFGVVSLLISHQATLRDALATLLQYRHLLNESLAMQLENVGKMVIVREEVVVGMLSPQATELAIGVLFRMCAAFLGGAWHPHSVNFTHAAPADLSVHRRVFDCRVEFGSEFNGFVFSSADLDAPNPSADPVMASYAQRFLESLPRNSQHSTTEAVRQAIYLMLPMGRANSECVAQGLGLSVRTMQRQLDEDQASFTDLLNEVRRELVQRYLANAQYNMTRIADLLGYSTPSAFTRWFATHFGQSPSSWRRIQAQQILPATPRRSAAPETQAKPVCEGAGC